LKSHATGVAAFPAARSMPQFLLVRTSAELRALERLKIRHHAIVLLRVPGIPHDKSDRWERKLNSHLKECGCSLGAKFTLLAAGGSVIWQVYCSTWGISHWPWFVARTLIAMFVCGILGKSLGIALARIGLRNIQNLIHHFEITSVVGG
jgi:hypothetical protein